MSATKRERKRLAKSELLMYLAATVERWKNDVSGVGVRNISGWPSDDPFVQLCNTYDLLPADLAGLLDTIGNELENRAMRAGYEETWIG